MKNIIYLGYFCMFLLTACKKDKKCNHPLFKLDEEINGLFIHPIGSYWVYQDSLTNSLDTVKIISIDRIVERLDESSCEEVEFVTIKYLSSKSNSKYKSNLTFVLSFEEIDNNQVDQKRNFFSSDFRRENLFFPSWTNNGTIKRNNHETIAYLGSFEAKVISGKKFFSVKRYTNTFNDFKTPIQKSTLYISENVGFIRKEFSNGEVWNLIDYKID